MDGRVARYAVWKSRVAAEHLIGISRLTFSRAGQRICSYAAARGHVVGVSLHRIWAGARALSTSALLVALSVAYADGAPVMQRARLDYDAKGIPLGAFRLFPVANIVAVLTDNVLQTSSTTESDVGLTVAPALTLVSEWSQHFIELFAGVTAERYADFDSENVTDWELSASGRLDIQRGSALFVEFSTARAHDGRSSVNSPANLAEPVQYDFHHASAKVSVRPNRMRFVAGAEWSRYTYDSTPILGGGFFDNSDRDRGEHRLHARVSLEVAEGYLAFVEAAYDRRDFDRAIDRTGVNRDSHGTGLNAGVAFELVEFLHGEAFVGHLERQFGASLNDFSGLNYGVGLTWSATQLTTVHVEASRTLNESTLAGTSVVSDRRVGVGIDHELRRNVILQAAVAHIDSEFVGTPREDSVVEGRVGAIYLIDRNLSATASYQRLDRESNVFGEDFSENKFNVGLRLQF